MSLILPVFACDTSVLLPMPKGYHLGFSKPYNKNTKRGWLLAFEAGACQCGKPYAKGHEIQIAFGDVVGCAWCQKDTKPTAMDLAGWQEFTYEMRRLFPLISESDFDTEAMPAKDRQKFFSEVGKREVFHTGLSCIPDSYSFLIERVAWATEIAKGFVKIEEKFATAYRGAR